MRLGRPDHVRLHRVTRFNAERTIRCVAAHYGQPQQTLVDLAYCETGGTFDPKAYNAAGPYSGLYQHDDAWDDRAASYGHAGASPFNGYANLHVSIQYIRDHGFGIWGVCYP